MSLLNYTTQISADRTVSEIQQCLVKHGANSILNEYDNNGFIIALSFKIKLNDQDIAFRLPSDWRPVLEMLQTKNRIRTINKCLREALTNWGEEVEIPIIGEIKDENVVFYDKIEEKLNKPNKNIHKVSGKSVFKLQEIIKNKSIGDK